MTLKTLFISLVLSWTILMPSTSVAQRSIGDVKKEPKVATDDIADVPVKLWLGKKFIFLEKPKSSQKYGFDLHLVKNFYAHRSSYDSDLETDVTSNLRYDKFVGRIMTVVDIEDKPFDSIITFQGDETKRNIYGKPYKGRIDGIALIDDMEKAKTRWLGKTVYAKLKAIITYSAEFDKFGDVKVQVAEPLKVSDLWWGFYSIDPLWLIVETSKGERGFISFAYSWTNIYRDWWKDYRPWEDKFFEENPKVKFKWTDDVWNLISSGKVKLEMTKEQVQLSWGRPKKVNEDIYQGSVREQWVYDSQYLYFENDQLTAMQNR